MSVATKLEGGGGKALVAGPLKTPLFFCGFPKHMYCSFFPIHFPQGVVGHRTDVKPTYNDKSCCPSNVRIFKIDCKSGI